MNTALPPELQPVLWTPHDAGPVLYTSHHVRLNRRGLLGLLLFLLFTALIIVLPAILTSGVSAGIPGIALLVVVGIGWGAGVSAMRVRICERALILDTPFLKSRPFVVPYATLDPDSVLLHSPQAHAWYPYRLRNSGEGKWPDPAMNGYIAVTQAIRRLTPANPLNVRAASWIHYGVSFRGLHPVLASPYYRAKGPARRLGVRLPPRLPVLMETWEKVRDMPRYRHAVSYHGYPVIRWIISSEHPERLLRALENAMIGSGVPGAAGMTDRALARPYASKPRTIPDDPAVW